MKKNISIFTVVVFATFAFLFFNGGKFAKKAIESLSFLSKWQLAGVQSPFIDLFSTNIVLAEEGSMGDSSSSDWWLNSGAYFYIKGGISSTIQGPLPKDDPWRIYYEGDNIEDTDGGYYPQNIFRLVTRTKWQNLKQEAYYKITKHNLSASSNRNQSNGLLLFNRYQNGDNLYYTGIRVDGDSVIKKKKNGNYYTMAQEKVFDGSYDASSNPNLIPQNVWIGLRSEVSTNADGTVDIKLYMDNGKTGNWTLIAQAKDNNASYGGAAILTAGYAGIRTDFMDVEFSNYKIEEAEQVSSSSSPSATASSFSAFSSAPAASSASSIQETMPSSSSAAVSSANQSSSSISGGTSSASSTISSSSRSSSSSSLASVSSSISSSSASRSSSSISSASSSRSSVVSSAASSSKSSSSPVKSSSSSAKKSSSSSSVKKSSSSSLKSSSSSKSSLSSSSSSSISSAAQSSESSSSSSEENRGNSAEHSNNSGNGNSGGGGGGGGGGGTIFSPLTQAVSSSSEKAGDGSSSESSENSNQSDSSIGQNQDFSFGAINFSDIAQEVKVQILSGKFAIGMQDERVKTLQEMLSKDPEIYPERKITGFYGPATVRAVQRFQKKHGLVDSGTPYTTGFGLAGPKTREKLNEVFGGSSVVQNVEAQNGVSSAGQTSSAASDSSDAAQNYFTVSGASEISDVSKMTPEQKEILIKAIRAQINELLKKVLELMAAQNR